MTIAYQLPGLNLRWSWKQLPSLTLYELDVAYAADRLPLKFSVWSCVPSGCSYPAGKTLSLAAVSDYN